MSEENNKYDSEEEIIILIDEDADNVVLPDENLILTDTEPETVTVFEADAAPKIYGETVACEETNVYEAPVACEETVLYEEPVTGEEIELYEEPEEDIRIYAAPVMGEGEYTTDETVVIPNIPMYEETPALVTEDMEYDEDDSAVGGTLGVVLNRLLVVFGIFIAIIAIFVGISFFNKISDSQKEVVDFSDVGVNVAQIGNIGEDNINAITAAQSKRLDELHVAIDNFDYNEVDEVTGVTPINLTLTTVLKDLKIKFVNGKNKLIPNVPFMVEVKDSKGKVQELVDEDKDGIVYISDLEGGSYTVKLISLDGYDTLYDFQTAAIQSINVKSKLDYKAVDVSNEIKTASQVNTATEDTAEKDTTEESSLKDTVAYVMSTKTADGNGYAPIDKNAEIKDPIEALRASYEVASVSRFSRLSGILPPHATDEGETSASNEEGGTSTSTDPEPEPTHTHAYTHGFTSNNDGTHKAECECAESITESCSITYIQGTGTHLKKCSKCGYETASESCVDANADGKCDACDAAMPVAHEHTYTKKFTPAEAGKHTAVCDGENCNESVVQECTMEYKAKDGKHYQECKYCQYRTAEEECIDNNGDKKCDTCKLDMPVIEANIEFSGVTSHILYFYDEKATNVTATVKFTTPCSATIKDYAWSVTGDSIIPEGEGLHEQTISYTPVKGGASTLKCEATLSNGTKVTGMLQIMVTEPTVTFNYTTQKLTFIPTNDVEREAYKLSVIATMSDTKRLFNSPESFVWTSSNTSVAVVDAKGVVVGVGEGMTVIRATYKEGDKVYKDLYKEMKVFVTKLPKNDNSTKLLDVNGKPVYVYDSSSKTYREATYADYYTGVTLYKQSAIKYKYTGWWTIDGKTYYFDANGKAVTGEQVILGAKYNFDNDGVLKNGTGSFGIDVSSWNGNIDWTKVAKSGVNYAIIRCGFRGSTVGGLVVDSKFESNIKNATAAGIKVGVYFFTQAITETEAVEEASMVLEKIKGYKIAYPVFIDVENATNGRANSLSVANRTAIVKAFCKTIENGGYKAGIYANKTWLSNKLNVSELSEYKIWLAQYVSTPTYSGRYEMWQYKENGSITGITGSVDLNLSYLGY